ncbi:MAG TPA: hypothetical protein VKY74_12345 [Chloroflexia bacterium]|nr:hypothetical protein [Chloroflexia bacterium]
MIEIHEQDFQPLERFPYLWRWNILPPAVRAEIRLLTQPAALAAYDRGTQFYSRAGHRPKLFQPVGQLEAAEKDAQQVRQWLERSLPDPAQRIVVSWGPDTAVITTAAIFCTYWDDFCYPASDDADIIPLEEDWIVVYRHEEVLYFGACPVK